MTCFWKGTMDGLCKKRVTRITPEKFITFLKKYNYKTYDVLWNGRKLSEQELKENQLRVHELKLNSIWNGYDCSSCDPFLLLISQVFKVHIEHDFNGTKIRYTNIRVPYNHSPLKFRSNRGHFWNVG